MKLNQINIDVEFSNNGITDSLTDAPAPKIFLDNLAREIAKSKRKFQAISIVTVQLNRINSSPNTIGANRDKKSLIASTQKDDLEIRSKRNKEDEKVLVSLGLCLKSKMRSGDFYSRFAETGFWVCIQGDLVDAMKTSERFSLSISCEKELSSDRVIFKHAQSEWKLEMNQQEFIQSVDLQFFDTQDE